MNWPLFVAIAMSWAFAHHIQSVRKMFIGPWRERIESTGLRVPSYPETGYSGFVPMICAGISLWLAAVSFGWLTIGALVAAWATSLLLAFALASPFLKQPLLTFRLLLLLDAACTISALHFAGKF